MPKEYCPDCVEPLKAKKLKLGGLRSNWLKCPKCGFIKRPGLEREDEMRSIKIKDSNLAQIDRFYEGE